jgi:hypothetical protein
MRSLIGMIIGCLLTVAVVYVHDSMVTSTVANGVTANSSRAIVNWDVAATQWAHVQDGVRTAWLKLTSSVNG